MAQLSVCIEMFWRNQPPEKKISMSAELGFKAAEFWGWQGKDIDKIKAAADAAGVKIATFCMATSLPPVNPNAREALKKGLQETIPVARKLGVNRLILTTGNERTKERFEVTKSTVIRNLKALVPILESNGIMLCIEPLNTYVDHLGYWLACMSDAADICAEIDSPWVKILMDIYHQQITEGNIIQTIREYSSLIGHYHCAGVPGRHELVGGELDYRYIFKAIDETGYDAYIGLEFSPTIGETDALKQALSLV